MAIEIKLPSPGESVTQAMIANWLVRSGDFVSLNAEIAEIESDKATLPVYATASGIITLLAEAGTTLDVGTVIASIEASEDNQEISAETNTEIRETRSPDKERIRITPLAKKMMQDAGIAEAQLLAKASGNRRITRADVKAAESFDKSTTPMDQTRKKMSPLRLKLAQRLVSVKNETAMLTTFNEVDMSALLEIKNRYSPAFKEKTGYSLGFVSFFAKAAALAMKDFPEVNACIEGDEIVYFSSVDINIAVSSPKGLLTPVIRKVETMPVPDIEMRIKELGSLASQNRIRLEDLAPGSFTVTNGGVFGSMLSTPIINPPQTAILGMHKVSDRPVALNAQVVIRPVMYVALSYDHRLIDGKESVGFLVKVKQLLEQPESLLKGGTTELDEWLKSYTHAKRS
jgi:2-oxoglutarate dehydrogenase E2 component (dihydrolipoamide succinyltransferase)